MGIFFGIVMLFTGIGCMVSDMMIVGAVLAFIGGSLIKYSYENEEHKLLHFFGSLILLLGVAALENETEIGLCVIAVGMLMCGLFESIKNLLTNVKEKLEDEFNSKKVMELVKLAALVGVIIFKYSKGVPLFDAVFDTIF